MIELPIYLVSLEGDRERRNILEKLFPHSYSKFIFQCPAIDGRKLDAKVYYDRVVGVSVDHGRLMSPSELGCTLSHIEVLNRFLQTNEQKALIVEDDIVGNDGCLIEIFENALHMDENSIYICGGEQGTSVNKFLFGMPMLNNKFYKLSGFSRKYILRTCCYVVTRTSAKKIIDFYLKKINLADSWGEMANDQSFEIYYSNTLRHPEDLSMSHIELERMNYKSDGILKKIFSVKVFSRVIAWLTRHLCAFFIWLRGYRRLDVG